MNDDHGEKPETASTSDSQESPQAGEGASEPLAPDEVLPADAIGPRGPGLGGPGRGGPGAGGPMWPPQGPPARVDRLEMVEPSLWTRGLVTVAAMLALGAFWFSDTILAVLQAPDASWRMLLMVIAPPVLFGLYLAWRWWDLPRQPQAIVFADDHIVLPSSPNSKSTHQVAYDQIEGIMAVSRGPAQSVIVDTGGQTLSYSVDQFRRDHGATLLRDELLRRIRELPNSDEIFDGMHERQKLARIAQSKPATLTKAILGSLAAYFFIELWTGAMDTQLGLLDLGANAPALIDQGQWFRLISANFLHQGWVHIILNGIALLFLGAMVEKLMGSWRLLLIYLAGAIGGSIGSYLLGPGVLSVGSSTAIFGLFGAFLALNLKFWHHLTPPFRQSVRWWVIIIALNAGLPVVVPIIDYAAHLTGFLAGGIVAYVLLIPQDRPKPDQKPSKLVKLITVLISAVFVAGLAQAAIYATNPNPDDRQAVFGAMLDEALEGDASPDQVNYIAWTTATEPDASRERLERVLDATEDVVEANPDRLDVRDTLATVRYRLAMKSTGEERADHIRRAVDIEQRVLEESSAGPELLGGGQSTYASQLARFADYHREVVGPLIREDVVDSAPELSVEAADGGTLRIEATQQPSQPVNIYAPASADGEVVGLLRTCLPAGQAEQTHSGRKAMRNWPEGLTLEAAVVEPGGEGCAEAFDYWEMTEDIAKLP
ncbi:MAG: rhomboid family intramembrane serine protease [Persicimonas sp.]